jgi:hypothetical protein
MVFRVVPSKFDFERSLNLFNAFNVLDCWSNTSMTSKDSLLLISDDGSQWHLLKALIDLCETTVWIIDVLTKSLSALISESKVFVYVFVFMVSSEQNDLLWISEFESEQKTNNFQTVHALVDVVSKKEIVECVDVSSVDWSLPDVEESHQINVLSMEVSKDLHWWSDLLDHNWLSSKDLRDFICKLNNVLSLAWEISLWLNVLTLLWLEQWLQKHLAKSVIWVFINLGVVLLLGIQFLWFFSKFINRNLSNNQREVFGSGITDLVLLVG